MKYEILTPLIPFVIGIILKIFLDFNHAIFIVKYFSWIPVRNIYRTKPVKISGQWTQIWKNEGSEKYKSKEGRKSKLELKQLAITYTANFGRTTMNNIIFLVRLLGKILSENGEIG